MMNTFIFLLMLALIVVLVRGIITLARGTDAAKSNRLMVWRVVIQGLILFLIMAFFVRA
jgi:hypothetical protein